MSWKDRLEDNKKKLHEAKDMLQGAPKDSSAANTARLILGSQRCKICGEGLVPLFNAPGPYVCDGCVKEFKEKIAGGEMLFCDHSVEIIRV